MTIPWDGLHFPTLKLKKIDVHMYITTTVIIQIYEISVT